MRSILPDGMTATTTDNPTHTAAHTCKRNAIVLGILSLLICLSSMLIELSHHTTQAVVQHKTWVPNEQSSMGTTWQCGSKWLSVHDTSARKDATCIHSAAHTTGDSDPGGMEKL
jgi:hypothetical protein